MRDRESSSENSNAYSKAESSEKVQKVQRGPILRSRSQIQSHGIMANLVSIAIPIDGNQAASYALVASVGDQPRNMRADSAAHQARRRNPENILSESSNSIEPRVPSTTQIFRGEDF